MPQFKKKEETMSALSTLQLQTFEDAKPKLQPIVDQAPAPVKPILSDPSKGAKVFDEFVKHGPVAAANLAGELSGLKGKALATLESQTQGFLLQRALELEELWRSSRDVVAPEAYAKAKSREDRKFVLQDGKENEDEMIKKGWKKEPDLLPRIGAQEGVDKRELLDIAREIGYSLAIISALSSQWFRAPSTPQKQSQLELLNRFIEEQRKRADELMKIKDPCGTEHLFQSTEAMMLYRLFKKEKTEDNDGKKLSSKDEEEIAKSVMATVRSIDSEVVAGDKSRQELVTQFQKVTDEIRQLKRGFCKDVETGTADKAVFTKKVGEIITGNSDVFLAMRKL